MLQVIQTVISGLMLVGIVTAVLQVRAALRISRANVLLRLLEEWNSNDLYQAIRYMHSLRIQWKNSEPNLERWHELAKEWVRNHINADPNLPDESEKKKVQEWMQRRLVSQFISRMGNLMQSGYIKPSDFFNIVPEVPRLIMVLNPIEQTIMEHFKKAEKPIEEWDYPFQKIAFDYVKRKHKRWFNKTGKKWLKKDFA